MPQLLCLRALSLVEQMNWEDLRIFLEVSRAEKLSVAARRLGIDASTVSRRLHQLETSLSAQLFERTSNGHVLTPDGKLLVARASKMEQDATLAFEQIALHNTSEHGTVRIGATEAFGNNFIAPNLTGLQTNHPKIEVELLQFARDVKISRNEADIAIMVERPKSTSMIVTKLTDYQLQIYGSRKNQHHYQHLALSQLPSQPWVSYVDNLLFTEQLSYLDEVAENIKPVFRSTSIISQYSAIKSGLGIGILPCFLAEQDAELVKLVADEVTITRSLWLVTHPELKRLERVATVWEFLKMLAKEKQHLLLPQTK
ncbi:LysR family transcriptional regulator [Thalassotalea montiporae]